MFAGQLITIIIQFCVENTKKKDEEKYVKIVGFPAVRKTNDQSAVTHEPSVEPFISSRNLPKKPSTFEVVYPMKITKNTALPHHNINDGRGKFLQMIQNKKIMDKIRFNSVSNSNLY